MKSNIHVPSLLPYLNPASNHFYLKISLISEDASLLEGAAFPFLSITDSDPLCRLIEAKFVSDAGSEIKKVFLMIQRDQYLLPTDELWPFNNRDVETVWHKAFSRYRGEKGDGSVTVLANQIDEEGKLLPLQSLFFCKARQVFFHPPCPRCGSSLEQCSNDELLVRSGLQPYSASLKRHLFCPSCSAGKGYDFYVYELENKAPPELKDWRALVRGFGLLLKMGDRIPQFPCFECPKNDECYGEDLRVLSRIVPFSFYPFYMMIFEAMSLNALDFLPLISGASFEEVEEPLTGRQEMGRINCLKAVRQTGLTVLPFFFKDGERYFLEVLYLKLAFLGEMVQNVFSWGEVFKHPDLRLSLDRIWINIPLPTDLLPFFWNFKVKAIDLGRNVLEKQSFPRLPMSYGLYSLGLLWLYALLTNKRQDMSKLSLSFREEMDHLGSSPASFPVNIFWDPEGKTVDQGWHPLWEKALGLGWSLIQAGFGNGPEWSREEFWKRLEELRGEIRNSLFQKGPAKEGWVPLSETETQTEVENKALHDVLMRLMHKWAKGVGAEKEEIEATVILPAERTREEPVLPPSKGVDRDEMTSETVILSPSRTPADSPSPSRMGSEQAPLSEDPGRRPDVLKRKDQIQEDDFSTETIILPPGKMQDKKRSGNK